MASSSFTICRTPQLNDKNWGGLRVQEFYPDLTLHTLSSRRLLRHDEGMCTPSSPRNGFAGDSLNAFVQASETSPTNKGRVQNKNVSECGVSLRNELGFQKRFLIVFHLRPSSSLYPYIPLSTSPASTHRHPTAAQELGNLMLCHFECGGGIFMSLHRLPMQIRDGTSFAAAGKWTEELGSPLSIILGGVVALHSRMEESNEFSLGLW
ncbi:hypothetical protein IW261DRAFT_1425606 [Armillaria novae-zelandiae]|uniref:Uncharacterized protein n=1 Tax=Armillaria novae-zelandiae TaxID=153914 RepID=A0AA39U580_9AGAR|nr:hypothetical protein IW261DRAFT_1425606 [Armillaria novae-zelandiae]